MTTLIVNYKIHIKSYLWLSFKDAYMKKVEIFTYYSFGYNYYILLNESSKYSNQQFLDGLNDYVRFIDNLELKVTKSSLELQKFNDDVDNLRKKCRGKTKDLSINPEFHKSIISKIQNTDKTLDAELNILTAYYIQNNKRVATDLLENKIEKLFSEDVFDNLPEIAVHDFQEAGKCLLFNRFTACAFHTLRGTEDTLKFYYQLLLDCIPKENQTWFNFHEEIEKAISSKVIEPRPSEELMINLNSLRKFYRNKTQHPQMIYNSDDVQDLMFLCIKTVNEMVKDLISREKIEVLLF